MNSLLPALSLLFILESQASKYFVVFGDVHKHLNAYCLSLTSTTGRTRWPVSLWADRLIIQLLFVFHPNSLISVIELYERVKLRKSDKSNRITLYINNNLLH